MANKGDKSVGLIDGQSKEKARGPDTMGSSSSAGRIWMVVAIVFIIASLALAGYIIYVKAFEQPSSTTMTEEQVVKRYPLMFRTEEEQKQIESQFMQENAEANLIPADNITDKRLTFCNFNCPSVFNRTFLRRKRSAADDLHMNELVLMYKTVHALNKRDVSTPLGSNIYHGCCISQHYFISPDSGVTSNGESCTVVQFGKSKRRQYFPSQKCQQANSCSGCTCAQETTFMTAVVVNKNYPSNSDEMYTLAAIKIPGCCKCFNNLILR
ncbi:hypothetical protein Btru_047838 [Bulinus truncatus]|nr:hypothetical protein Btru_047838 [Bulinus truncatus]